MPDTISNLLQNKLLLQYLAGAGGAMSAGEPIGPALNQITQQNISAQNFAKLLAKMLGGEVPEGGKVVMDSKGMKMDIPSSALSGATAWGGVTAGTGGAAGAGGTAGLSEVRVRGGGMLDLLNPSSSSAISGADLAGLTPEMISQALQFKFGQAELEQKSFKDIVDMIYKGQLGGYYEALTEKETPSITIPGTDIVLTEKGFMDWYKSATKDERTAAVKNYEYAQGEKGGGFKGSFEEFQDSAKTTHWKDYQKAKDEGYEGDFNTWLQDMTALGGGLSLGEYGARFDVKAKKYFTDPEGLVADVDKYINTDEIQNQLMQYVENPQLREREMIRLKENYIRSKVAAAGGAITDERLDGRTFVFTVRWQDGTTSEVKYAN